MTDMKYLKENMKEIQFFKEIKYLKEIVLIIIDTFKEAIILFVALIVILNYYINVKKGFNICQSSGDNNEAKAENDQPFKGPWECLKDIMISNLDVTKTFLETCTSKFFSFLFIIASLYYFFYVIKSRNIFSLKGKQNTFDRNIQFIYKDFFNKLTFILVFPTVFISIFSLLYISIKIMFDLPTKGPKYGFIMSGFTKFFMNLILFPILFITIGQTLYHLFERGNISYLYTVGPADVFLYTVSIFLISILMFVGFYKLLLFNLKSTFVPNFTDLIKELSQKEMLPFYFIIPFILFVILLMNIKDLFSFEIWIFSVMIFFMAFTFLGQTIYRKVNE